MTNTAANFSTSDPVTADELDKQQIEQLHAATLRAADSCFEMKKLCATVLVPTATLVALFTNKVLGNAVFGAGIFVVMTFWLADSVGFYYQRKLRSVMDGYVIKRAARCTEQYTFKPAQKVKAIRAIFNQSMIYYLVLTIMISILWGLFLGGAIG